MIIGYLVFSTLHTRDTIGAVFRLTDLGVEPYMVAQGLHVVLSQRLARQLSPHCKEATPASVRQIEKMGPAGDKLKYIQMPKGCPRCLGTGFSGRRAFYELLKLTPSMREVILRQPSTQDIERAIGDSRFVPLRQSGYELVAQGLVPFEEIERTMG